jgi:hypothetical protein
LVKEVAVAAVGDEIRVLSGKGGQPSRDGVVTAVSGALLRVRWSTGEETSLIPGPGAVTVTGKARTRTATKRAPAAEKKPAKKAATAKKSTKASVKDARTGKMKG